MRQEFFAALSVTALSVVALVGAALVGATQVRAKPVLDCPLREAPFSLDTPLMDILLSDRASAIADAALGGKLKAMPANFVSTQPPSFAAILSLRQAAGFAGVDATALPDLDKQLRALPVTDADRSARCARYDDERPSFTLPAGKPHLLLFEKMTGFKDVPSFDAAHTAFLAMAERNGWHITITDKAGAFNPHDLGKFSAVIWNNISGDVLTLTQREAFRTYIENGGAYVGVHGSAGDPSYLWDWYADTLIGARFIGHAMQPQFQDARIVVDDKAHPAAARLPSSWTMTDEWYSFASSPRQSGANIVATLDEKSYSQVGPRGIKLSMGDHPIAWSKRIGKGRMFYSAIGHLPQTYSDPQYVAMLEDAISWIVTGSEQTNRQ